MTQRFRFHVINNSKCFLNSQSGLHVSSKSKSYLNHDYTSNSSIIKSEKDNKMLYCTSGLACYQQFKMVEETSHSLCWSQQSGTIGVGVVIIQDSKVLSNLQSSLLSKFPSLDVINNSFKIVFSVTIGSQDVFFINTFSIKRGMQGDINCSILPSGMGVYGEFEREFEEI